MSRRTWDEYFMDVAKVVATRATCPKKSVGAVLVKDRHILATGYNGAPSGMGHCTDPHVGCELDSRGKCVRAIHAEVNAIGRAAGYGIPVEGATLYINWAPCPPCQKVLAAAGIARVVYGQRGSHCPHTKWAGIKFERLAGDALDD